MLEAPTAPESARRGVHRSRCEPQWWSSLLPTHPTHVPKSPSLWASSCHICAGLGGTTQGQYSRSEGKGHMQHPLSPPLTKTRAQWGHSGLLSHLTIACYHMIRAAGANSQKSTVAWAGSALLLLPSTTPLWGPLCKCSGQFGWHVPRWKVALGLRWHWRKGRIFQSLHSLTRPLPWWPKAGTHVYPFVFLHPWSLIDKELAQGWVLTPPKGVALGWMKK